MPDDLLLVGRVARAHGNKGQVIVNPETDFPEERFAAGHELIRQRVAEHERNERRTPPYFVGKIPAVGEVAHAHREELGALRVGRPGQKAVIG